MATQSLVMGEAFGKGFQYGKRKISAMSNEEFNNETLENIASKMFKSYENIIPDLKNSIEMSTKFQNFIFAKLLDMPRETLAAIFGAALGVDKPSADIAVGKSSAASSFQQPSATGEQRQDSDILSGGTPTGATDFKPKSAITAEEQHHRTNIDLLVTKFNSQVANITKLRNALNQRNITPTSEPISAFQNRLDNAVNLNKLTIAQLFNARTKYKETWGTWY